MIKTDITVRVPKLDAQTACAREGAAMAKEMSEEYARQLRIALVNARKIASGDTLRTIQARLVIESSSRGIFRREVVAGKGFKYVVSGRKPGAKMPVHVIGKSKKGKNVFAPLPELVRWFLLLNIPSRAWWPIMRKIKRKGIKGINLPSIALRASTPRWTSIISFRAARIAGSLFRG